MSPPQPEPPLSVLFPCRDAGAHLPDAIRSLEAQTFRDFEVIAVDDGSRDETREILERWAARDPRVRLIRSQRNGLPRALQEGADACRGELIARFDADDVAHPRRFAAQVRFLSRNPDLVGAGTRVRYFPHARIGWGSRRYERWLNGLAGPEAVARDLFVECPIPHPTLMIRRSALRRVGGYRANGWPEDYDLVLRLHGAGCRLANVPRVLHFWREGPDRLSRTDPRYTPEAFRRCKIAYLRETHLRDRDRAAIWGAGNVGKAFARALDDEGIEVTAFFDIDPDKIGQRIYGIEVADAASLGPHLQDYLLVAVGAPGARELIRHQLIARGLDEPDHYRCVA